MDLYIVAKEIILNYGYFGIFFLSMIEAIFFPIPPDVFLLSSTYFGLDPLLSTVMATLGTVVGGTIGYFLGYKFGHPIFLKLFNEKYLIKGEEFFNKYGVFGIVIAGFTPIPYKVIAWLSGIFEMNLCLFVIATFIGRFPRFIMVAYFGDLIKNLKIGAILAFFIFALCLIIIKIKK
ncbi:lipoprotein B LppB [Methanocaldococcus villosus KIN24-T80]|uniref:Lipoprotein B LppB n=1 Tax=Methanocaldococcus villosus KIN24-T80 TaxID=1069083 RepID=N6V236_9EURY|nr:YqaA family protein [Methanocaldococcus villosus]ENN96348.1 lipoprotein B LppB [Methanocaldococcus villosus KIN24-T80]